MAQELPTTHSYKRGAASLDFYEQKWTDSELRQYLDAIVFGVDFHESSDHAPDCYDNFYSLLDSVNGMNINITAVTNSSLDYNYQVWKYFESILLYVAESTANQGANTWGNCSVTAIDNVHTILWYTVQWRGSNPI